MNSTWSPFAQRERPISRALEGATIRGIALLGAIFRHMDFV
jgi:hypothetical protein